MLHKTEKSQVSTNAQQKTTSFYTPKLREMFREAKKNQPVPQKTSVQLSNNRLPNDLISLQPETINNISWPEIFIFENDLKAAVKDNFYQISGIRGNNKFLPRNSQVTSEIIYFNSEKPTKKINLFCIQRYIVKQKEEQQLWNHINLSKYDPHTNISECSDFYLNCEKRHGKNKREHQTWDFRSFQPIQNCKKGIIIMHIINRHTQTNNGLYKILLLDLVSKKNQKENVKILASVDLDCQLNFGRNNQKFIKSIKSQFGDVVLIATNRQIYQLQIEDMGQGHKLSLKPYNISKTIIATKDNYLKSQTNLKSESNLKKMKQTMSIKTQQIEDVQFMTNGLKIMILTNYDQIIFIQAHNFLFSQNMREILSSSQIGERYKIDSFFFTNLYSINGSIVVQFKSKNDENLLESTDSAQSGDKQKVTQGFVLLKAQNNYLTFNKIINLPFQSKQIIFRSIHGYEGLDQILIQYIQKKNINTLSVIKCRTLMTQLNSIIRLDSLQYNYSKNIDFPPSYLQYYNTQEQQKKYIQSQFPLASRVFYLLNDRELVCYKIFNQLDSVKISKNMTKLSSHAFFQKPIKLTVSPLTMHFAIIFKDFVKFFYFNYYSIRDYFTMKVKNVLDVKYVLNGSKIVVSCADGFIYLLDAYTFQEQQIMQFYGEPCEVNVIDQKNLIIKSNKQTLVVYKRGWDEQGSKQFSKEFQIKIEEGDLYTASQQNVILFKKNGQIDLYSHFPLEISKDLLESEKEVYDQLQSINKHLVNRIKNTSLASGQVPTKILLNQKLGFLFVATNKGNIKQYLWPLQNPTDPNPPEVFTQQVSSSKIISMDLDAKYTYLYAVSQEGTIIQLQMRQYIGGELMPYVYIFNEKTINQEQQKRQFTDRTYFIDHYVPTQVSLVQASQQSVEQLQFFMDKLKDDLEEMTKTILLTGKQKQGEIKNSVKVNEESFKKNLREEELKYNEQLESVKIKLQIQQKQAIIQRSKQIDKYEQKLLALYKQSDRLKKILKDQDEKLTEEKLSYQKQCAQILKKFTFEKDQEVVKLQQEYKIIQQRRILARKENQILDREEDIQMKLYKVKIHQQEEGQLRAEDEYKEKLLGENAKKEKAINNLKNRSNYFENLILQTRVQIGELKKDQIQYQNKKEYLKEQLKDKEEIIEKIQKQLVLYLKNTEDMKTIKNNHEFELNQYEKEVNPIQDDYKRIEDNVKHMNLQIMKEYNHKVEKADQIKIQNQFINALKEKKKRLTIKKLQEKGKFIRLSEKLTDLAKHTFDLDIKKQLKECLENSEKDTSLVKQDQQKQRQKKEGQKLLRYKNMIRKQIQEEEKREQHIIKNQHQFYKYHIENTTLVRQFNDLKKTQKILSDQYYKLMEKLSVLKASQINTPLKRASSINLKKIQQKKLTPFQRYEQEQNTTIIRKNQDTTDTKLSRNSQSISFLKALVKEVNQTESKVEKMEVMRERVRTFVNPQLKNKGEEIKKILFGRTRGTSQMLKLK